MNDPTLEQIKDAAKQAEENAVACKELIKIDLDDGYFQASFDYHTLAAAALNRWAYQIYNE